MTIRALIIDDEVLARKRVYNLLKQIPEIEVIGECRHGEEAIYKINALVPDLIFLDIELKDMNGFDVLKKLDLQQTPLVIFVTAYDQFALKAFEIFAFDYLLKPFENERFILSVKKAIQHLNNNESSLKNNTKIQKLLNFVDEYSGTKSKLFDDKFPVRIGNKINFIDQKDIKYILASGSYSEIQTITKKITVRDSLSNLIELLDHDKFLRIHRSVIINIGFILEIIHSSYYELDVKMQDGSMFRVSKSYRKAINNKLGLK